jgi:hypothetical protein
MTEIDASGIKQVQLHSPSHLPDRTADCAAPPQALQVLSNPSHPELPAKLRLAAAAITASNHNTLRIWLQGGLFTHLLRILRSLPALKLSPADATDVCAATTAVLVNIIFVARDHTSCLPGSATLEQITYNIASLDVLAAVVKHGMLGPAAVERLQPGREIHVEHIKDYRKFGTPSNGSWPQGPPQFWTPLRICGHLLVAIFMQDMVVNGATDFLEKISKTLLPAANTGVFQHLLETALEDPGGRCPVRYKGCDGVELACYSRDCAKRTVPDEFISLW